MIYTGGLATYRVNRVVYDSHGGCLILAVNKAIGSSTADGDQVGKPGPLSPEMQRTAQRVIDLLCPKE